MFYITQTPQILYHTEISVRSHTNEYVCLWLYMGWHEFRLARRVLLNYLTAAMRYTGCMKTTPKVLSKAAKTLKFLTVYSVRKTPLGLTRSAILMQNPQLIEEIQASRKTINKTKSNDTTKNRKNKDDAAL